MVADAEDDVEAFQGRCQQLRMSRVNVLGREVRTMAPVRSKLIDKGMIYCPAHGDTAFTVPLFDEFMKRIMPDMDS